jgi:single-stranded-DNA-specific exonuclease
LAVLNQARRPGVAALAATAGVQPGSMTAETIGFALGPRINAAGRLAHAYDAAKLLAAPDSIQAKDLAQKLNRLNQDRRRLTVELSRLAEEQIVADAPLIFAARSDFRSGVVGLVASRLAERYYRPAIVVEQGERESRGSCRSIPEFHITAALDQVADLLVRHGGHAQAAGFTVANEKLPLFRERMMAIAAEALDGQELLPTIDVDAELELGQVEWALHGFLTRLEPTGVENTTPLFVSRGLEVESSRAVGQDAAHLQLIVGDGRARFKGIAFRQAEWARQMPDRIDLAYSLSVNEWNGSRNLELMVQDIQASE